MNMKAMVPFFPAIFNVPRNFTNIFSGLQKIDHAGASVIVIAAMAGLAFGGYLAFGFDWVGHGFISIKGEF